MRSLLTSGFMLVATCSLAGQVVRVAPHSGAVDIWGSTFDSQHKITFEGKVTGIEKVRPPSAPDDEITLLVKNRQGGGTAVVDLGPAWFVNHQVAKIRVGDRIQVTGSKVIVEGHGVILSSMIVLGGRGGQVLALRRPNGRAYWIGTEVVQHAVTPTGSNVVEGTVQGINTYMLNNLPYASAVMLTGNGSAIVDLGPQWYYGQQSVSYQVGDHLTVVVGQNPITVGNATILPTYTVYQGANVYSLRFVNGSPVYLWGQ